QGRYAYGAEAGHLALANSLSRVLFNESKEILFMSRSSASSTRLKERTAGASALAVLFALTAGAGGAAAQPVDDGWHSSVDVIDHGGVAEDINVRTAAAGTLPDGRDVAYMHSNGNPVSFHVVDLE